MSRNLLLLIISVILFSAAVNTVSADNFWGVKWNFAECDDYDGIHDNDVNESKLSEPGRCENYCAGPGITTEHPGVNIAPYKSCSEYYHIGKHTEEEYKTCKKKWDSCIKSCSDCAANCKIKNVGCTVYMFILFAAPIIAVVWIIIAALKSIGAADDPNARNELKATIIHTTLGLIIVVMAISIVQLIIGNMGVWCIGEFASGGGGSKGTTFTYGGGLYIFSHGITVPSGTITSVTITGNAITVVSSGSGSITYTIPGTNSINSIDPNGNITLNVQEGGHTGTITIPVDKFKDSCKTKLSLESYGCVTPCPCGAGCTCKSDCVKQNVGFGETCGGVKCAGGITLTSCDAKCSCTPDGCTGTCTCTCPESSNCVNPTAAKDATCGGIKCTTQTQLSNCNTKCDCNPAGCKCPGDCVNTGTISSGATCGGKSCLSDEDCNAEEYCKTSIVNNVIQKACTPRGESGSTCSDTQPCNSNYYCSSNGQCTEKKSDNADCSVNNECKSGYCDQTKKKCATTTGKTCTQNNECGNDLFCKLEGGQMKCAEKLGFRHPCIDNTECKSGRCILIEESGSGNCGCMVSDCTGDKYCNPNNAYCTVKREVGENCDSYNNTYIFASCKTGKCGTDSSKTWYGKCICSDSSQCGTGKYCNSERTCSHLKAIGDPCEIDYTGSKDGSCIKGKCSATGKCGCKSDNDCGDEKYCDGKYNCQLKKANDEECSADNECASGHCVTIEENKKCKQCGETSHCKDTSKYCSPVDYTCKEYVPFGSQCETKTENGNSVAIAASCKGTCDGKGTCVCNSHDLCPNNYCSSKGICKSKVGAKGDCGGSMVCSGCNVSSMCTAGYCDTSGGVCGCSMNEDCKTDEYCSQDKVCESKVKVSNVGQGGTHLCKKDIKGNLNPSCVTGKCCTENTCTPEACLCTSDADCTDENKNTDTTYSKCDTLQGQYICYKP